jgi:hypothetical protein
MANTNSALATAHATAQTSGRSPLDPLDTNAILLFIRSQVTCPATPSANDTLTLVPGELIPAGARYAPEYSWVYCETDPGTALTLDIGPTSNPDGLADALALTTAGTTGGLVPFDECGTLAVGMTDPIIAAANEDIIATVTVSTSVDATVIQFCIAYYAVA